MPLPDILVLIVFIVVYYTMAVGKLPGLSADRTGIAMAGAFVLLAVGSVEVEALPEVIEFPTLLMLFVLMLLGAHFAAANSFNVLSQWLSYRADRPRLLLAGVVISSGVLSMVLVNDIVVFAFTPVLCMALIRQGLDPRPYLLALAGAANAGSAVSLIGNPQNILIGSVGGLSIQAYFLLTIVPVIIALAVVYFVVSWVWRHQLQQATMIRYWEDSHSADRWLFIKSLLATVILIVLLVLFSEHRYQIALGVVLVLLLGRVIKTDRLLREVDLPLLVLIASLFVVTATFSALPMTGSAVSYLETQGWLPDRLAVLIPFSLIASNTIGNVPAVMLLLGVTEDLSVVTLQGLALFSTLAGNLLLTGSLANIIVAERAASQGIKLGFIDFMRVGIPVTILSMIPAAIWFSWATGMRW
ncbi:SLC13 family permease [Methylophaga sp.]|uniref:SLC13 family permease n=1 Tax=Methylophaga sp. TaxID=2024840 RepID=UPI00271F2CE9|nr:SLC13 family permease [Methylophaga sp.]MDO8825022.1 SLC13 family permease [Methylophaga sp.]